MTVKLLNQLKDEVARLQKECVAIENLIVLGSNLPPPHLGPPPGFEFNENGHPSPRPQRNGLVVRR